MVKQKVHFGVDIPITVSYNQTEPKSSTKNKEIGRLINEWLTLSYIDAPKGALSIKGALF